MKVTEEDIKRQKEWVEFALKRNIDELDVGLGWWEAQMANYFTPEQVYCISHAIDQLHRVDTYQNVAINYLRDKAGIVIEEYRCRCGNEIYFFVPHEDYMNDERFQSESMPYDEMIERGYDRTFTG